MQRFAHIYAPHFKWNHNHICPKLKQVALLLQRGHAMLCVCQSVILNKITRAESAMRCYASAAYAIIRCPSVCVSVTFVHSVKTNKHIFKLFSPSGSQAILDFPYQTTWQYSDGNPLTVASNAGRIGRNHDFEPISGFMACCECCNG